MPLFDKEQFSQQNMELLDILYMQDVDIGVTRDDFIGNYQLEVDANAYLYENKSASYMFENSSDVGGKQSYDNSFQFSVINQYVDSETGELVSLIPSDTPQTFEPTLQQQLSVNILDDLLPDETQVSNVKYEQQSSFDERMLDVYDVLGLPTSPEESSLQSVPYMTETRTASVINDFQQFNGDTTDLGIVVPIVGLEEYFQYAINGNAEQSICLDTNGLSEHYNESMKSPDFAVSDNAPMVSSMLTPPSDIVFDMDAVLALPSPDMSNFFNASGLESDSMSLFIQNAAPSSDLLSEPTSVPNFIYEQANLLLSNTVFPSSFDSNIATKASRLSTSSSLNSPTGFSGASFYGLDDWKMIAGQTVGNPVGQLPTAELDTDCLLQQMLQSEVAEDYESADIVAGENAMKTDCYDTIGEDGSSGSVTLSVESVTDPVTSIQEFTRPMIEAQGWLNVSVPKFDAYQVGPTTNDMDIFDEVPTVTYEPNYKWNHNSSPSYDEQPPSQVIVGVNKSIPFGHNVSQAADYKGRDGIKEEIEERDKKQNRSRDEKRAKAMKIPLSVEQIIDTSVEEFTEILNQHQLTDAQQQLIRDIRRRGKNKMAAQNCRKRKMEVIGTLDEQVTSLRDQRDILNRERSDLDKKFASLQDRFQQLEMKLFQQVRDKSGRLYDRNCYSLLQTDDGGLFIIPRASNNTNATQQGMFADRSHSEKNGRKRK